MANHQLPQLFLQESPRTLSWDLSCSYFSITTCHLSSHQPPDCLQMTVFCIEGSEPEDQAILQRDLDNLQQWENNWLMRFNPDKCEVLIAKNKKSPIHSEYTIHGQVLNQTDSAKYLGLNIHKSLSWDSDIDKIPKKANSTFAFLGRNVNRCPTTIKAQCSPTLVRPTLEYASSIWSPSKKDSINKVEAVQRRAAKIATGDYQHTSSVTAMLQQLQWQTLQSRRAYAQTVMVYRSVQPC